MDLWPVFMLLAIALHLADRAFGFGYLLSAIAVIIFGMSAAFGLGYPLAVQEPFISVLTPLILIPAVVRAIYVSLSPEPNDHDRNVRPAIIWVTAMFASITQVVLLIVITAMCISFISIVYSEPKPPLVYVSTALIAGGGFLGNYFANRKAKNPLPRTIILFIGITVGALSLLVAIHLRHYRDGIISIPTLW